MKKLLDFITENKFVQYKDDRWYRKGSWKPWQTVVYYTNEELIKLYENEKNNN